MTLEKPLTPASLISGRSNAHPIIALFFMSKRRAAGLRTPLRPMTTLICLPSITFNSYFNSYFNKLLPSTSRLLFSSHPPRQPSFNDDPYSLLKIEQVTSQGLPMKFDGKSPSFAQFLEDASSHVSISVWHDSPFIEYHNQCYNLFHDFISIPQSVVETQATSHWTDPTKLANHSKKATTEFHHIKLLCLFLLHS